MTTAKNVMKMIKDNDVKYVDFRFTPIPAASGSTSPFDVTMIEEDTFAEGPDVRRLLDCRLEGDQRVRHEPDAGPGVGDDRSVSSPRPRWVLICDVLEPTTGEPYNPRPRAASPRRPRAWSSRWASATPSCSDRRPSSFVFDDVKFKADPYNTGFKLDSVEFPSNSDTTYEGGKPRPSHRHQEGLLPGAAAGLGAGYALGNARRHGAHGLAWSRSITTRWHPPQHELGLKFRRR